MSSTDAFATMRESGVVAVLRGAEPETVVDTAEALVAGGVTALEVTADTAGATDMIATLSAELGDDALVGAGTVLDSETARAAVAAGAEFVVSPSFDEGVVETCNRYGVLCAPGVMTPTEAVEASEAGAEMVKVFPAKTVGPDHVAALKGPLGQLEIMPTGGVSPDNAGEYIEAGAVCVGAGSALVDRDLVDAGDFDAITERAERFRAVIEDARE
ncbi:bifunctional 4-hydroxy-2-oxoglutarate aldolase/2-dehydro-3-deoxy-phosphogluconate aldolase [Halobaculum magnesiiphilum]|uniref:Bifunctional 4-hydroxy-2-oxoglutarate aldolase/2-dehydro-3-deoxy-phosphogluconate aldolase n=1 Tax=Halobaculum magnesiiphilum TaxID=1017351 RepID=A0A8T8WFW4_9EURY|nr:bifunctional 4-hydroxy-2-oxoglutarate aldolase/2-dehydro-3-deoxy-phosphogluconate aldolase [Halobaculum magnesiiphilum]QZP38730.1 bifunctional 4-hydroxy-2-oxoglutarate aldolase/2-dehydro-3-deoxy-phosphogluconate aldolase [Halobaculum magnesiiphilum]